MLLPVQRCAFPAEFLAVLSPAQRREAEADAAQTASDVLASDEIAQHHATNDEIAAANVRRARRSSVRMAELHAAEEHMEALEESIEEEEDDAAADPWGMASPAGEDSCDNAAAGVPEAEGEAKGATAEEKPSRRLGEGGDATGGGDRQGKC